MNSVVTPLDEAAAPSGRPRAERWSLAKIERYAYDGWNMIMTVAYNGSFTGDPAAGGEVLTVGAVNGRVASYVWGPDIASRPDGHSSWQRAGGVGGLLMVVDGNGAAPGMPVTTDDHFFPLMDRLGNVTGYRKAATGLPNDSLSAVLEYDPFGQEVRSTGPASDLVPFYFSTK